MPDLNHSGGDWIASSHVDDLGVDDERNTKLGLGHVVADILSGDVVWALSDLRAQNAGGISSEEDALERVGRGGVGSVVVKSKNACESSGLDITSFLKLGLTPVKSSLLETSLLHLLRALAEISLVGLVESSTLSYFFGDVMTWVGEDTGGESGNGEDVLETHCEVLEKVDLRTDPR